MNDKTPETVGGITLDWINEVAACLAREGRDFRKGAGATIEVQAANHTDKGGGAVWMPLTLEKRAGGDCTFASEAERDVVLAAIESRVYVRRLVADPTADRGRPDCRACKGRGYVGGPSGTHDCDCAR